MIDTQWVTFWRAPWLFADASWLGYLRSELLPHLADYPTRLGENAVSRPIYQQLQEFSTLYHPLISTILGVTETEVPEPQSFWLQASAQQRHEYCVYIGEIVAPGAARRQLSPEQRMWCNRISAALRLNLRVQRVDPADLGLAALALWQPSLWSRLRWLFSKNSIERAQRINLPSIKPKTLDTIWQAVIWQSQQDASDDEPPSTHIQNTSINDGDITDVPTPEVAATTDQRGAA